MCVVQYRFLNVFSKVDVHSKVVSLLLHRSCCCMRIKVLLHQPGIKPQPLTLQAKI